MNAEHLLTHFDRIADAPDAIPSLRRFILDLAVRGKLVEQDPNDEPAEELLKRISAEKKPLVEAGEIKKQNDLSLVATCEAPFSIPDTWEWTRIGSAAYVEMGQSPPSEHYNRTGHGIPFFQGKADFGKRYPTARYWCTQPKKYAAPGDILISVRAPVGPTNIASEICCIGRGLAALRSHNGIDRDYLLRCLEAFELVLAALGFGTTFVAINKNQLVSFVIPLPPLSEQHRIVAKVDELMALCDRLETERKERETTRDRLATASLARLNAPDPDPAVFQNHAAFALNNLTPFTTRPDQIKALRQTILNLAVRGKLVEQDLEDEPAEELLKRVATEKDQLVEAGKIRKSKPLLPLFESDWEFNPPPGWEWIRLGTLVLDSKSGWSPQTENHAREGDAWGILKVSAVSWNHFDSTANKQVLPGTEPRLQAQVHKGDFLISRANTAELVARAVLVQAKPRNLMMSDKIVRLRLSSLCDHNYILLVNNFSDFARSYYAANATGVSPSMKNVSRKTILDLPFPLPPLAEQHRIVARLMN